MKDSFQKLSNNSEFFNEKRFVFRGETPKPAPKKDDVLGDVFGDSIIKTPSKAKLEAAKAVEKSKMANEKEAAAMKKKLDKMSRNGYEFPGRNKVWEKMCKDLAKEGVKVTKTDVWNEINRLKAENPGNVFDFEAVKKAYTYNKAEQLKVEIHKFFSKDQSNLDYFSRALAELYLIRKGLKGGEKNPKYAQKSEQVKDEIRNKIRGNYALARLLPNLGHAPAAPVVALRNKPSNR